jgi:Na+-translocating ferredoxin:NAD+ oxidoreductase RNF subunit RnfB
MIIADITNLWNSAWPAGLTLFALAAGFAIVLLVASIKLKVKIDPKIELIYQALPHADCGACGQPGCAQYAKALASNPTLLGKCAPGGKKTTDALAKLLGLAPDETKAPIRPVIHCRAHSADKTTSGLYSGIPTCLAANSLSSFQACRFGCLGLGDCVASCKFDAIKIVDGLATVDYDKCTGCGACAKACPRNIIEMVPFNTDQILTVACSSKESGKDTRTVCKVGCIACKLCTKQSDLFTLTDNLAKVDYQNFNHSEQTDTAQQKCPTKVIISVGKNTPAKQ